MLTVVRRKLVRSSGIAFPSTNPRFNPAHPASLGISPGHGFSGIATPANFVNLLNGTQGTKNGTPTGSIVSPIGPAQLINSGSLSYTFPGQSTANDTSFTCVTIVMFTATTANSFFFTNSSGANTGVEIGLTGVANNIGYVNTGGGSAQAAFSAFSNGVPYFIAISGYTSGNLFLSAVVLNLATGAIQTNSSSQAGAGPSAPNGTYMIGNGPAGFLSARGNIAAVAFIPNYMSLQQLVQWAADPWFFWYPR